MTRFHLTLLALALAACVDVRSYCAIDGRHSEQAAVFIKECVAGANGEEEVNDYSVSWCTEAARSLWCAPHWEWTRGGNDDWAPCATATGHALAECKRKGLWP